MVIIIVVYLSMQRKIEISSHERLVATTTVTMPRDGPVTATSIIETHPTAIDNELTPRNQKRSFNEPQANPSAPPLCNLNLIFDLILI